MTKALIVVAIVLGCIIAKRMQQMRERRTRVEMVTSPRLPDAVTLGSPRTWVIFTTKYCAQCGPIEELLRSTQPDARVVTIDAEREPVLARAQHVRSAPTVLLANANGVVEQRLVGANAVTEFLRAV